MIISDCSSFAICIDLGAYRTMNVVNLVMYTWKCNFELLCPSASVFVTWIALFVNHASVVVSTCCLVGVEENFVTKLAWESEERCYRALWGC